MRPAAASCVRSRLYVTFIALLLTSPFRCSGRSGLIRVFGRAFIILRCGLILLHGDDGVEFARASSEILHDELVARGRVGVELAHESSEVARVLSRHLSRFRRIHALEVGLGDGIEQALDVQRHRAR